jgi:hypothetical protein
LLREKSRRRVSFHVESVALDAVIAKAKPQNIGSFALVTTTYSASDDVMQEQISSVKMRLRNHWTRTRITRQQPLAHGFSTVFAAQWRKQFAQVVVIDFVHQREQPAELSCRKTLTRKPCKIVAGQVRDQAILVLSIRHLLRDETLQIFGVHRRSPRVLSSLSVAYASLISALRDVAVMISMP